MLSALIDRSSFKEEELIKQEGTFSDPHIAKFRLLLNKDFQTENVRSRSTTKIAQENNTGIQKNSRNNINQIKKDFTKAKKLKDFYPLTAEDCRTIQSLSKREFLLNSMNEILLDMSKRLTDRCFKSKKAFLSYMGKVFCHEKRDAVRINNDGFKIINNLTLEEIEDKERETYLSSVEERKEISSEWQLKKKLASKLQSGTAYKLLKSFEVIDINNGICNLYLSKHLELTDIEQKIILQEVQATYQQLNSADEGLGRVESLKIIMPAKTAITSIDQNKMKKSLLPPGMWGRVRQSLIEAYGEATDRNWFSKLTANIDEERKEIKLKSPTDFVKDWIETNYFDVIERLVNNEQFKVYFC